MDNGTIYCFTFSPDGKTIASCSGGTIHLWDVATGREVWRVDSDGPEYECVSTLAFSRDGKLLACCGSRPGVDPGWSTTEKKRIRAAFEYDGD